MKRIAIFGGSFSPFHIGHFLVCKAIQKYLKPHSFYLVPNKSPVDKPEGFFSTKERLEIINLILFSLPFIKIELFEIKQKKPSLSYLTCNYIREKHPKDQIFFTMGTDCWLNFKNWEKASQILDQAHLFHVKRKGFHHYNPGKNISKIDLNHFTKKTGWVIYAEDKIPKVSSSEIMSEITTGEIISSRKQRRQETKKMLHHTTSRYLNL